MPEVAKSTLPIYIPCIKNAECTKSELILRCPPTDSKLCFWTREPFLSRFLLFLSMACVACDWPEKCDAKGEPEARCNPFCKICAMRCENCASRLALP